MSKTRSPNSISGFHCVGWVHSAHGLRGELFIRLFAPQADWRASQIGLQKVDQDQLIQFDLKSLKPHKDGWIAVLEGVHDRTAAEALVKHYVHVSEAALTAPPGEGIFLRQILGFQVVDRQGQILGEVTGFGSNGPQDLLKLQTTSGREALVPLIDDFLLHIDFDKRQLSMDLPPGLLNLEEE